MDDEDLKTYVVKVVVEWELEVEAISEEDAEYEAADLIMGPYNWGREPDYESYYAELAEE